MIKLSFTEENYLKALLTLSLRAENNEVGTNELAVHLQVKPASANDMLKRLREKSLVEYERYGKIFLSKEGRQYALDLVRKHRLWETFLYEKLNFSWDEIHELAEELEHIQSDKLINRLDQYLGYPQFDPHGDPIPAAGQGISFQYNRVLFEMAEGNTCLIVAIKDADPNLLQYAQELGIRINLPVRIIKRPKFDDVMLISLGDSMQTIGKKMATSLRVLCSACLVGEACSFATPCKEPI